MELKIILRTASRRPVDPIGSSVGRRLDTKRKRFICSAPTTVEGRRSLYCSRCRKRSQNNLSSITLSSLSTIYS